LNKQIATSTKYNDERVEDEFQAKMNRLMNF